MRTIRTALTSLIVNEDKDQLVLASQLFTLKSSLTATSTLLRNNKSSLLAAKLLVLARLLHKSLSAGDDVPPILDGLGSRLGSLRQKLLRHVDRRLALHNGNTSVLVEDLTAFSLATSSSPSDVLTHFQHLRTSVLGRPRQLNKQSSKEQILERLQLYFTSIRDSRAIFPELLGGSLRVLGSHALLQDSSIAKFQDLSLDVHEQWFSEDVRNYTPWTRHEQLSNAKRTASIEQWSIENLSLLAESILNDIAYEQDISLIATIRRETLQAWLSARSNAKGLESRRSLQQLQQPFISRCEILMSQTLKSWENAVCTSVFDVVEQRDMLPEKVLPSLWDPSSQNSDMSDGAMSFRRVIVERRTGRNELVRAVLKSHDHYVQEIEQLQTVVRDMRDIRWDDDFDDDDDNGDGVEGSGGSIFEILSRRDPQILRDGLRAGANSAIRSMQNRFTDGLRSSPETLKCDAAGSPGISIYRSIRELRQRLPHLLRTLDSVSPSASQDFFCQSLMDTIQDNLVASVSESTSPTLTVSLSRFSSTRVLAVRALWDNGDPALPVQPSAAAFRYLRTVVKRMEGLGTELWSPDCVNKLKTRLVHEVRDAMGQCMADCLARKDEDAQASPSAEESKANGVHGEEANTEDGEWRQRQQSNSEVADSGENLINGVSANPSEPTKTEHANPTAEKEKKAEIPAQLAKEKLIQLLFDALYLNEALSLSPSSYSHPSTRTGETDADDTPILRDLVPLLSRDTALQGDEVAAGRLRKSARDYWRRTHALFGLLSAPG